MTDLQLVRSALDEIHAQGVDVERDIVKAVRKGIRPADNYPGTVMVEMRDDTARASVMKNKKTLENHHNPGLRKLIIKNYKSEEEMKADRKFSNLLKRIPGSENCYFAGNGQIRENNYQGQSNQSNQFQRPASQLSHPPVYNFPPPPPPPRSSAQHPTFAPPPPPPLAPLIPPPIFNPSLFDSLIQSSQPFVTGAVTRAAPIPTTPSDSSAGLAGQQQPDIAPAPAGSGIDIQSKVTSEESREVST